MLKNSKQHQGNFHLLFHISKTSLAYVDFYTISRVVINALIFLQSKSYGILAEPDIAYRLTDCFRLVQGSPYQCDKHKRGIFSLCFLCLPADTRRWLPCHSNCLLPPGARNSRREPAHRCVDRRPSPPRLPLQLHTHSCTADAVRLDSNGDQTTICHGWQLDKLNLNIHRSERESSLILAYPPAYDSRSSRTPIGWADRIYAALLEVPRDRYC